MLYGQKHQNLQSNLRNQHWIINKYLSCYPASSPWYLCSTTSSFAYTFCQRIHVVLLQKHYLPLDLSKLYPSLTLLSKRNIICWVLLTLIFITAQNFKSLIIISSRISICRVLNFIFYYHSMCLIYG